MGRLEELKRQPPKRVLVHFDAQSWLVRDVVEGSLKVGLPRKQFAIIETQPFNRRGAAFQPGEVRDRSGKMDCSGGADRAERIVRQMSSMSRP